MSTTRPPVRRTAFCGIDVGTQGVRAEILDVDGLRVGSGETPVASGIRRGTQHEQDPSMWWRALTSAVRSAITEAGDDLDIAAVALDATSGTVLIESEDGNSRGPALMYDDSRATAQAQRAQLAGGALWSALGYRMQTSWALPKVMWLNENGALGRGDRVVHQSDHLVRRLAGRAVATDTSNALKTGVDLRTGEWPTDVFTALDLDVAILPAVVTPGSIVGHVGREASGQTGLMQGTIIRAGMTDGCAAQIASGALRSGSWSSALGTTLVIKGSTEGLVRDPHGAVYCHRNPDGGWLPGGASSTGAGVFTHTFGDHAPGALDELTRLGRHLVPVPGVTYALVGNGERFPFVAPEAHGFMSAEVHDDAAKFASLCQSIAYIEKLSYDTLASLGADVSGPVALSGGATRNAWWNQLRTDVLGRPTILPRSVQAATGMAILAAAPVGSLAETAEKMVRIQTRYEPDLDRGNVLHAGYKALVEEFSSRGWLDAHTAENVLRLNRARP
jgi:sugar (pentulose or hexulose) kinase